MFAFHKISGKYLEREQFTEIESERARACILEYAFDVILFQVIRLLNDKVECKMFNARVDD